MMRIRVDPDPQHWFLFKIPGKDQIAIAGQGDAIQSQHELVPDLKSCAFV
jgi:hypothetical protein